MTKVLLIYNMVPEELKIYNLEADPETYDKLIKCHGKFCNQAGLGDEVENLLSTWLPNFLMDHVAVYEDNNDPTKYIGWTDVHDVICTGFIL